MSLVPWPASTLVIALVALALEAAVGWPAPLYAAIGHPVTWIGRLISALDRALNREEASFATRRAAGVGALAILLATSGTLAWAVATTIGAIAPGALGLLVISVLAASLPAQKSLDGHVAAVADGLERGLAEGRAAVSMIVGRDPNALDEAAVARAAIESLAENFSDGIVAPLFWTAVAGLPGGLLYKAANTADSMIGHRTPRHEAFGWAAARFDDLVNLPASRLAALWLILAALVTPEADARRAVAAVRRDAKAHGSPNAGWPEAAMAGAHGFALAGPRVYHGEVHAGAWMGDGRSELGAADIRQALRLYRTALAIQAAAIAATLALFALV
ncbi:MAG: adenosylcobinamide-phosphate synthase CbiB [Hyphomicrobiales bacterium]|nr:adenosylcobinamide-phosphate synthase CbiB [Hyphomicrobiales bacterium]